MTDLTATPASFQLLAHPVQALRAWVAGRSDRVDDAACAAGLTVEVLPGGVHRYRDPRLDHLANRGRRHALISQQSASGNDWSTPRLVTSGRSR
jgi:hypothetical protein